MAVNLEARCDGQPNTAVIDLKGDIDGAAEERCKKHTPRRCPKNRRGAVEFSGRRLHQQQGHRADRDAAGAGAQERHTSFDDGTFTTLCRNFQHHARCRTL